jgi:uncharacterized membrane protein (GlpM family)
MTKNESVDLIAAENEYRAKAYLRTCILWGMSALVGYFYFLLCEYYSSKVVFGYFAISLKIAHSKWCALVCLT